MAIFSPGLRRRRCSVRRRAKAPVMAAASSAPAPKTARRFSELPATAGAGAGEALAAGEEPAVGPDGSAKGEGAGGVVLTLGFAVAEAGADGE
ncbi:hypothetical protein [Streptomyces sp. 1222.5]|uniref:hypothetical protein n=1 Tax=Streptomyces sp. 1222.5 TaxID=1881026 RepID=UPI003EBA207D